MAAVRQHTHDAHARESLNEYRNWVAKSWKLDGPSENAIRLFTDTSPRSVLRLLQRRDAAIENLGGTMFGVLCSHFADDSLKNELLAMQVNGNRQEMKFADEAITAMTLEKDGSYKWQHLIDDMTGKKTHPASPFGSWNTVFGRLP